MTGTLNLGMPNYLFFVDISGVKWTLLLPNLNAQILVSYPFPNLKMFSCALQLWQLTDWNFDASELFLQLWSIYAAGNTVPIPFLRATDISPIALLSDNVLGNIHQGSNQTVAVEELQELFAGDGLSKRARRVQNEVTFLPNFQCVWSQRKSFFYLNKDFIIQIAF